MCPNTVVHFLSPLLQLLIGLPLSKHISHAAAHDIRNTQAHGGTPHNSSCAKLLGKGLFPSPGNNEVCSAPGGGDTSGIGRVAVDVKVRGEEQDGREEHGQLLEGTEVLGCD